jgi:homoserine dehydrogenase
LSDVRLWVVGLGTVGRWLIHALDSQAATLSSHYGFTPRVVGVANERDGFVHDARGLDHRTVLGLLSAGRPLTELPGVSHWPNALAGLEATEADVLVEATASPRSGGEPGVAHMREALGRRISVVTSNKWPVALHGVELAELARTGGAAFRAESTVMSGTPVLSTLIDGLAGTSPVRARGILNATANFILTAMEVGKSYDDALVDAQEAGLAERDPSADVDGYDSMAKTMILAGLVFGEQLRPGAVLRRGIGDIDRAEIEDAIAADARVRLVSTLESRGDGLSARVEPVALPYDDPLARIAGVKNAVMCDAQPVGQVTITGPGAGPELAGQGVLSDLIAVARRHAGR